MAKLTTKKMIAKIMAETTKPYKTDHIENGVNITQRIVLKIMPIKELKALFNSKRNEYGHAIKPPFDWKGEAHGDKVKTPTI